MVWFASSSCGSVLLSSGWVSLGWSIRCLFKCSVLLCSLNWTALDHVAADSSSRGFDSFLLPLLLMILLLMVLLFFCRICVCVRFLSHDTETGVHRFCEGRLPCKGRFRRHFAGEHEGSSALGLTIQLFLCSTAAPYLSHVGSYQVEHGGVAALVMV